VAPIGVLPGAESVIATRMRIANGAREPARRGGAGGMEAT